MVGKSGHKTENSGNVDKESKVKHSKKKKTSNPEMETEPNEAESSGDTVQHPSSNIVELDEQTRAYYERVQVSLEADNELDGAPSVSSYNELVEVENSSEDKELLLNNVFQQMVTESLLISKDSTTSHIVEKLLNHASGVNLTDFVTSLENEWRAIVKDKFGSHVVQAILNRTFTLLYSGTDIKTDFVHDLAVLFLDELDEYMSDVYSSHVLRTMLELLAGVRVGEKVSRSRMSREVRAYKQSAPVIAATPIKTTERPDQFRKLLGKLAKKIMKSEKLDAYVLCPSANPILQTLFLVLKTTSPNDCDKYCRLLVKEKGLLTACEDVSVAAELTVSLPSIAVDATASHLLDNLIRIMPDDLLGDVHVQWEDKYVGLALHPTANFVLQKFLERVQVEQFDSIYDSLKEHIEDLLAMNHLGLVVKMAECANRHGIKQKSLLKHIFQAFHCQKPTARQLRCVPLIVSLTTYDVLYPESDEKDEETQAKSDPLAKIPEFNLHGSLLLQQMLRFTDATPVVASFLALSSAQLQQMALHPIGSHVIEAFVGEEKIDEKQKDQFFGKLENHYVHLACHKTGSRTFDTLWARATLQQKMLITENLSKMASKLHSDRYGQFIYKKCALQSFTERRGEWEHVIVGQVKRRRMFDDLVTGVRPEKRVKESSESERFQQDRKKIYPTKDSKEGQSAVAKTGKFPIKAKANEDSGETLMKRPSSKKRRRMKKMGLWNISETA